MGDLQVYILLHGERTPGTEVCSDENLASFPVPRLAFRRLQYGTKQRRKAGRGTGYEANENPY